MASNKPTYHADLCERLSDPAYAVDYLEAAFAEADRPEVFLLAVRIVAEAHGITRLARATARNRKNLYAILPRRGHPILRSIYTVLDALGLRLTLTRKPLA